MKKKILPMCLSIAVSISLTGCMDSEQLNENLNASSEILDKSDVHENDNLNQFLEDLGLLDVEHNDNTDDDEFYDDNIDNDEFYDNNIDGGNTYDGNNDYVKTDWSQVPVANEMDFILYSYRDDDGEIYSIITQYIGSSDKVNIPGTIDGKTVNEIGSNAFMGNHTVALKIPDNVSTICSEAFVNNRELKEVYIGSGVTTIEYDAFKNCPELVYVNIPDNITSLSGGAFLTCDKIQATYKGETYDNTDIMFYLSGLIAHGESGMIIENNILKSVHNSVTDLVIPDGVTTIADEACENRDNLVSVTIPDSVTEIGLLAFSSCPNLVNVKMSENVKSVSEYAFLGSENVQVSYGGKVYDYSHLPKFYSDTYVYEP